jgi:hypothetical protein
MEKNGVAQLNLDNFIWTSKGAEAVVRAWQPHFSPFFG